MEKEFQTPEEKRILREELSRKFCQVNNLEIRIDMTSEDRRNRIRKSGQFSDRKNFLRSKTLKSTRSLKKKEQEEAREKAIKRLESRSS